MAEFSLGDAVLGTAIDLSGLDAGLAEAEQQARSGFGTIGSVIDGALTVGLTAAAAGFAAFGAAVVSGTADARAAAQTMAQTEAVITSTGGAAQKSADQISELAASLSAASGQSLFGDDDIQQAENLLLTFTNIKGEVFDLATAVSVDMAEALDGLPADQAIQLGKALNDPIQGISALTRVGVTFDEQQKRQIETMQRAGNIAGAQKIILAELNKEFGGSARAAAQADGGWAMFQDRMGEAAETIGAAVLPLLNDLASFLNTSVAPAVEGAAETIAAFIPQIADFASDAFAWGANLGNQFAAGLASAAATVMSVLQSLGAQIAYWLQPGSPPNLLPEIDVWGQKVGEEWTGGIGEADISAVQDLGRKIQDVLKGLVAVGDFDEQGIIPAVLGSEQAIASAIASADEFGNVSEDAIRGIIDAAGPAGPKVEGLVRAFFDLRKATSDVARAQTELNRITESYAEQIDPLSAEIQAINDQQQAIDDQLRIRSLQEDIASGKLDELEQQKALLDIQEIQKRAELRGIERNRDAEVGAAEERLSAAELAQHAAQDRLADEQAAIQSINHQNELIGQQLNLLQQMQREAEAAAKAKASGGGGGGGPIAMPTPKPPDVAPVTGVLDELETQVADTQNQVELFFGGLSETVETAVAPAAEALQPLVAIFEDSRTPVEGLLNVLSEISPTFELLRGVVEAALPSIQSMVESVFDIITGLIQDHGTEMLASVQAVWTQIDILIQTLLPPIQSIVETVFGAVAAFLAENSEEIESFIATSWQQIADIIQTAVAIVNAIIVPAFETIATFLQQHSDDIQHILSSAWNTISGVIGGALSLIQGLLSTVMAAIQGDWQGAWDTLQATSAQFVTDVLGVVSSFLDTIAGFFGTSLDELAELWASNWEKMGQLLDMAIAGLVEIITGFPAKIAGVGEAVVNMIWDGIKAKWGELVDWFNDELQKLRDQLPFSEPKDSSSPLYGLSKSGESIVAQILIGLTARAGDLPTAMASIGEDGILSLLTAMEDGLPAFLSAIDRISIEMQAQLEANADAWTDEEKRAWQERIDSIVDIAGTLPDLIADVTAGMFDVQASVARQAERNLERLADFSGQQYETIKHQLAEAEEAAALITDPEEAAAFYAQRSKDIFELAELQKELMEAGGDELNRANQEHAREAERLAKERADLEAQLLAETDEAKRQELLAQLALNEQAQTAEDERHATVVQQIEAEAAAERARLQERIELIKKAQEAELAALQTRQEHEKSMFEELSAALGELFATVPSELIELLQPLEDLFLQLNNLDGLELPIFLPTPSPVTGFLGGSGLNGALAAPGSGFVGAGGLSGSRVDIAVELSLNSRGLDWLERLIDSRAEAVANRAAGAADARRRSQ
jgi:hypothetical protein